MTMLALTAVVVMSKLDVCQCKNNIMLLNRYLVIVNRYSFKWYL